VERNIASSADPDATRRAMEARQPLGRLVGPGEVAAAAVYLAAPTTYTTGISLVLDGGIAGVRIVR
jgi:NAD(P)-dependent dehydrogenase (short-subunit alcohol dehydrogenase family)